MPQVVIMSGSVDARPVQIVYTVSQKTSPTFSTVT